MDDKNCFSFRGLDQCEKNKCISLCQETNNNNEEHQSQQFRLKSSQQLQSIVESSNKKERLSWNTLDKSVQDSLNKANSQNSVTSSSIINQQNIKNVEEKLNNGCRSMNTEFLGGNSQKNSKNAYLMQYTNQSICNDKDQLFQILAPEQIIKNIENQNNNLRGNVNNSSATSQINSTEKDDPDNPLVKITKISDISNSMRKSQDNLSIKNSFINQFENNISNSLKQQSKESIVQKQELDIIEYEELRQKYNTALTQNKILVKENKSLQFAVKKLETTISSQQQNTSQMFEQTSSEKEQLNQLLEMTKQKEKSHEEKIQALEQNIQKADYSYNELKKIHEELRNELYNSQDHILYLNNELTQKEQEIQQFSEQSKSMNSYKELYENACKQVNDLKQELLTSKYNIENRFKEDINQKDKDIQQLKEDLEFVRQELEGEKQINQEYEQLIEKKDNQIAQTFLEAKKEIQRISEHNDFLQSRVQELDETNERLQIASKSQQQQQLMMTPNDFIPSQQISQQQFQNRQQTPQQIPLTNRSNCDLVSISLSAFMIDLKKSEKRDQFLGLFKTNLKEVVMNWDQSNIHGESTNAEFEQLQSPYQNYSQILVLILQEFEQQLQTILKLKEQQKQMQMQIDGSSNLIRMDEGGSRSDSKLQGIGKLCFFQKQQQMQFTDDISCNGIMNLNDNLQANQKKQMCTAPPTYREMQINQEINQNELEELKVEIRRLQNQNFDLEVKLKKKDEDKLLANQLNDLETKCNKKEVDKLLDRVHKFYQKIIETLQLAIQNQTIIETTTITVDYHKQIESTIQQHKQQQEQLQDLEEEVKQYFKVNINNNVNSDQKGFIIRKRIESKRDDVKNSYVKISELRQTLSRLFEKLKISCIKERKRIESIVSAEKECLKLKIECNDIKRQNAKISNICEDKIQPKISNLIPGSESQKLYEKTYSQLVTTRQSEKPQVKFQSISLHNDTAQLQAQKENIDLLNTPTLQKSQSLQKQIYKEQPLRTEILQSQIHSRSYSDINKATNFQTQASEIMCNKKIVNNSIDNHSQVLAGSYNSSINKTQNQQQLSQRDYLRAVLGDSQLQSESKQQSTTQQRKVNLRQKLDQSKKILLNTNLNPSYFANSGSFFQ